jgi:hypothetical protein
MTDDGAATSSESTSLSFLQSHLVVPFQYNQSGCRFSVEWATNVLKDTTVSVGKSLRNPLAISTILRLLRFLDNDLKDQWLSDILLLAGSSRKCVALLASLPDWQPCLFPLVSETLELVSSDKNEGGNLDRFESALPLNHNLELSTAQKRESLHNRLDRCLALYSKLLGHLVREGGDQVSTLQSC